MAYSLKYLLFSFLFLSCSLNTKPEDDLLLGGDFSYVNELEDCGASFKENGANIDPYEFFSQKGANISRIRLWHSPDWTSYSTLSDIKKSIRRNKNAKLQTLLDLHYSDTWADPAHQIIPKAWANITDETTLLDSVYQYTLNTLQALNREELFPEFIQIGNEINSEMLMHKPASESGPMNWPRQVKILNAGLRAVADFNQQTGKKVQTFIHAAQPDESFEYFQNLVKNGISDYDYIGLSYYPQWSKFDLAQLQTKIESLIATHKKKLVILETGYPHSLINVDSANNVLTKTSELKGYNISPDGQLSFLIDLKKTVLAAGANGIIYWEPAWVSSPCKTRWGTGSHWENASFFDEKNNNEILPAIQFFKNNVFN